MNARHCKHLAIALVGIAVGLFSGTAMAQGPHRMRAGGPGGPERGEWAKERVERIQQAFGLNEEQTKQVEKVYEELGQREMKIHEEMSGLAQERNRRIWDLLNDEQKAGAIERLLHAREERAGEEGPGFGEPPFLRGHRRFEERGARGPEAPGFMGRRGRWAERRAEMGPGREEGPGHEPEGALGPERMRPFQQRMMRELNLTKEQREKAEKIHEATREKMDRTMEKSMKEFESILTPEQREKFVEAHKRIEQARERRGEAQEHPAPPAPPASPAAPAK
jgi:Spy/CpxP family protein refolding chaperone